MCPAGEQPWRQAGLEDACVAVCAAHVRACVHGVLSPSESCAGVSGVCVSECGEQNVRVPAELHT